MPPSKAVCTYKQSNCVQVLQIFVQKISAVIQTMFITIH
jgi:hypothetical protein